MTITANSGPYLAFGITQTASGLVNQYNEERGPSLFDLNTGTLDPRSQYNYRPGSPVGTQIKGLFDNLGQVDYIPFTGSSIAGTSPLGVASSVAPVAGTAQALTAVASNGGIQTTIIAPETGQAVSVIALDSTAATYNFGTGGTVSIWNPQAGTGRTIAVINSSNANTEQYIVRGRDMYGFKMTEIVLASTTSTGTGVGRKAFKYIQSITPSTATTISATGILVYATDTYGLPIVANYMNGIAVYNSTTPNSQASLMVLSSANSVVASTIVTATATTADVRGTVTSTFASNGSSANGAGSFYTAQSTGVRLTITQQITAAMVNGITAASAATMFGNAQFSDF